MKTITIRVDESLLRFLGEVDSKPTTAVQTVVEVFFAVRRATLAELKGRFSKEEITAMADATNGTILMSQYIASVGMFSASIQDAETFQGSCSSHGADVNVLVEKINALTAGQVAVLQMELDRFWNVEGPGGYGSPAPDLEILYSVLG